jgi:hypothetical protein
VNIPQPRLLLSYNEVVPVVDEMCFSFVRYFDVELILLWLPPKEFALWLSIDAKQSCYFNQAIMEFGALQCVPKVQL